MGTHLTDSQCPPRTALGLGDTGRQDLVPAQRLPSGHRQAHTKFQCPDLSLYVGQGTVGAEEGSCPIWGAEGFPEQVRSELKLKDECELSGPHF